MESRESDAHGFDHGSSTSPPPRQRGRGPNADTPPANDAGGGNDGCGDGLHGGDGGCTMTGGAVGDAGGGLGGPHGGFGGAGGRRGGGGGDGGDGGHGGGDAHRFQRIT